MFTNGSEGFRNMYGPQIFPSARYELSNGDALAVYFKFSPIMNGLSPSFDSTELAAGASWIHGVKGHPVSLNADFADLNIAIQHALFIQSRSATFSVGYGL
jgi:hypothetical protein